MSDPARKWNRLLPPAGSLFLCGASILYWELVFIRWMGSCIRIVAYYSNFILVAAFLGLGAGALLASRKFSLERFLLPSIVMGLVLAPFLGVFLHDNPSDSPEYFWLGGPSGVLSENFLSPFFGLNILPVAPFWLLLATAFLAITAVFVIFGQIVGRLFGELPPLRAYSFEIAGSILGILLFGAMSYRSLPPTLWFLAGFVLIFLMCEIRVKPLVVSALFCLVGLSFAGHFEKNFIWSPYYKIQFLPMDRILDRDTREVTEMGGIFGYRLTVNNDYHQMIVDLRSREKEHPFFRSWRWLYDFPYREERAAPKGPILIVGGGTGNDVSAALRNTEEEIDVVEIDPDIIQLGRTFHPEMPYDNPRVTLVNDDARSFFMDTRRKYSRVVFGFLDSHTLLSSFSSVRLDNFVYTRESMQRVKEILLPGGRVFLTFAANTPWIHSRITHLLDSVFDGPTGISAETGYGYTNGVVYENGKEEGSIQNPSRGTVSASHDADVPTDDWPFLYLKSRTVPAHYLGFIAAVVPLSLLSLLALPRGERAVEMKYFFLGAGFFLIETSNVVKLSILYGSTWVVNITVFSGILFLILMGNLTCAVTPRVGFRFWFICLLASCGVSYAVPPSGLLELMSSPFVRGLGAVALFLGPVYFASVIFARLIREEKKLYAAYGSNLLGAMVGGTCEYLSLVMGFKFLILMSAGFYMLAGWSVWR
ncbi:MAG: hypothetical protein COV67_09345, partial [Nitrospinae bacterium CG11_big_fil_rev_8_21_14_0_20_56_8]